MDVVCLICKEMEGVRGREGLAVAPETTLADDGKRLFEGGTLYLGWLRRITYFSTELREGTSGGRLHRGGGWRIYVGGGF